MSVARSAAWEALQGRRSELQEGYPPRERGATTDAGATSAAGSARPTASHRSGFTLLELIVVIAIFLLISGMLLANFRRSRQGDIVRIAALRLTTDIQRMQSAALSGGVGDRAAVAYGVHVDIDHADRYVLFGDRTSCTQDQVCRANGQYDAGAVPAEELDDGTVMLPEHVRIVEIHNAVVPAAPIRVVDALFRPPRGTVAITPDTTEVRIILRHTDFDDTRTVTVNRISGRVSIE